MSMGTARRVRRGFDLSILCLKQMLRRPLRTGLTIAGIAIAMFLFTTIESMRSGVREATEAGPEDRTLVVYRENRWCPFTSRLPQWYLDRIERIDGVAAATPMAIRVSNCRASLDVVTFRGVPVERFLSRPPKGFELLEGDLEAFRGRGDAALVGASLAARRGLRVGDRFEAAGIAVTVAGVFASSAPQDRNVAYVPLSFLQESTLRGSTGGEVTQFNVVVESSELLETVAAEIDALFTHESHPTSTRAEKAFVARAARDVVALVDFAGWLGWAALAAVFGLVANAMAIAVRDRVRDHAVMATLGFTGSNLASLTALEGLLVGLAGGLAGAIAAWATLAWGRFTLSVEATNLEFSTDVRLLALGAALSIVVGIVAGLLPGLAAARRRPLDALRIS